MTETHAQGGDAGVRGVPIVRIPDERPWGLENCCFCHRLTDFWHTPKDVAVCPTCAPYHRPEDVPSKSEWCASVRRKSPTPPHGGSDDR